VTEIAEAVNVLVDMVKNKDEKYCKHKESPRDDWKCCISGLAPPEPTPARLLASLEKHKPDEVPDKDLLDKKKGKWDIKSCSPAAFPFQAHHLIPKKHLPTHRVCTWLAHKQNENALPEYQIEHNNNYNTDHANNGYCMPFVSTTYQWDAAGDDETKQKDAAFMMMDQTHIQLHQGSHSYTQFGEEEDDTEEDMEKNEGTGYLGAVDELLSRINNAAQRHVKRCKICNKNGAAKPDNVRPVESVVKQMDQASLILKLKVVANEIFVSRRAWEWHNAKY
jgi:hypothetical protein